MQAEDDESRDRVRAVLNDDEAASDGLLPGEDHEDRESRGLDRVLRERQSVERLERAQPLRRRLLDALADAPDRPGTLAERLDVSAEAVSRQLKTLRDEGLVDVRRVFGDGRMREYTLTEAGVARQSEPAGPAGWPQLTVEGEVELSRLRAFGAPEPAPSGPTPEATLRLLSAALQRAVAMRRTSNRLTDAADRLRVVIERAENIGARELAIEATAELATTLRQAGQVAEVKELLRRLDEAALDPTARASVALPAAAHRAYALGRLGERQGEDPAHGETQLWIAADLYRQLADAPSWGAAADWKRRSAWSLLGVAGNLRGRSKPDRALAPCVEALTMFEELEDPYGRSHCLFTVGFCLRLLGDFEESWALLRESNRLAESNAFERFQADSLMQMGEVRRCQGDFVEARALLEESLERSSRMGLKVTQAFAQSGLGSVEYQEQRLEQARRAFDEADALFRQSAHREGLALNSRRRAIVARKALEASTTEDASAVRSLIDVAIEHYRSLRSPAGLVACEIERGRLDLIRRGQARGVISVLTKRLDDAHQWILLELDPWLPRVLLAFAEQAEDGTLTERARRLLDASERQLATRAREGAQLAANLVSRRVAQEPRRPVDEMGGESRSASAHDGLVVMS